MTTTTLTVQVDRRGQAMVAKLIGSGDFRHVDDFSRRCDQIAAMRPSLLILDVTDLDFIASLMVGQIVALGKSVKTNGGHLIIAGPNADVRGVLERCRIGVIMPVHDSMEAAMAASGAAQI